MEYNTKIYLHKRLDTGEVFYVGMGGGDRPWELSRNKFWHNVVNKAGYEVVVIEDCLTWEQADEIEIMLIAHYGRRDRGKGPLVNLTDGGGGTKGLKCSPETRAKLSAAQKGNTKHAGHIHSPEARTKMSEAAKGKPKSLEHRAKMSAARKGKTLSPEHRAKLSAVKKGRTFSPETRAKLSAAAKARYAKNNTP